MHPCKHAHALAKKISIDSGDCLSSWVLYSLLSKRKVISKETQTHTALKARERDRINIFLIKSL